MGVRAINLPIEFPHTTDCETLQKQIEGLIVSRNHFQSLNWKEEVDANQNYLDAKKKWYEQYGCETKILQSQVEVVKDLADTFKEQDKARITPQTDKQVKNRIIIGATVILASLLIIVLRKK
jgi:hypothetical protein